MATYYRLIINNNKDIITNFFADSGND
jgi:hypothetical protein